MNLFENSFVTAVVQVSPEMDVFPAGPDYGKAMAAIRDRQNDYDCLITFLRFSNICERSDFFDGVRLPTIMLEHDAWMNFSDRNPYYRKYSEYLSRERVDAIVVSSLFVQERLEQEGHRCIYLPKGAPASFLHQPNSYSGFTCVFGSTICFPGTYEIRKSVYDAVKEISFLDKVGFKLGSRFVRVRQRMPRRNGQLPVHRLRFRFRDMPGMLSRYSASIICDAGMSEPMAKHFEVSALGLVPIRDPEAKVELELLGYKDGKSMIIYEDVDDLVDKLRYYSEHRDALHLLQDSARDAARANTWEVRAASLRRLVEGFLSGNVQERV
ncbi:MAG: glycosyltransferase [Candidatus Hydrogenedentes bacterium]|nr:glycosyltransferase [Candidatus Hydrogenedentota bacterium]